MTLGSITSQTIKASKNNVKIEKKKTYKKLTMMPQFTTEL